MILQVRAKSPHTFTSVFGENVSLCSRPTATEQRRTYHYVLIINLQKLVSKITGKEYRERSYLCHNCLHIYSSIEHLNTHQQYCLDKDSLQITLLETKKNKVALKNFSARWFSPFENEDEMFRAQCHLSGQFLGYAHNECNLKRRTLIFTPVIEHNLMRKYDLHHIVKRLHSASENVNIDVIPTNDEKFTAMNYGVYIETRKRKRDKVFVYEYLRFIDSFKFMPSSLSKLVQTLPDDKFSILDNLLSWI